MTNTKFVDATWTPYVPRTWLDCRNVSILSGFEENTVVPVTTSQLTGTITIPRPFVERDRLMDIDAHISPPSQQYIYTIELHLPGIMDKIEAVLKRTAGPIAVQLNAEYGNGRTVFEMARRIVLGFAERVSVISPLVNTSAGVNRMIEAGCQAIRVGNNMPNNRVPIISAVMHARMTCNGTQSNAAIIADEPNLEPFDAIKLIAAGANCVYVGSARSSDIEQKHLLDIMRRNGSSNIRQFINTATFIEV